MSLTCWLRSGLLGSTSWCGPRGTAVSEGPEHHVWATVEANRWWSTSACRCPSRGAQPGREAMLALRFCPVTLCPPRHRKAEGLPCVTLWAVQVREIDPPLDSQAH